MDLKETFEGLDVATLETWVSERKQENLQLDFKFITSTGRRLGDDDKSNFARCLSGFANSDGGIVVWGVDARKDAEGIDAAQELKPIANVESVLSTFQSLTGDAVRPTVDGANHRAILLGDGTGFIVTIVPPSDRAPHMASDHRYYKRSGDSFYKMEHFDVADMFGRKANPELELKLAVQSQGTSSIGGSHTAEVRIVVVVKNNGRGLARFPFVRLRVAPPDAISTYELGNGKAGLPLLVDVTSHSRWKTYCGGADDVIHPSIMIDLTVIQRQVPESLLHSVSDMVVNYTLIADGVRARDGEVRATAAEITAVARDALSKRLEQELIERASRSKR